MDMTRFGITERKQAWVDFLGDKFSSRYLFVINYLPDTIERPLLWPDRKEDRINWAYKKYTLHMERIKWLSDHSVPFLDIASGTEIFAEAFGCRIHRPIDNMPFALPLINSPQEVASLKVPDLSSSSLALYFEIADALIARTGKGTLLRLPDIQSPMDIVSLIWDKNTFYMALIEAPEAVQELSSKVALLLKAFLDQWFQRYGSEFIAHYPDYYMPYGLSISEDEIGVVNSSMFNELFLPELVELSNRYGAMGMHCCADARHQWENIKKIPNLKLINLVHNPTYIMEAYDYFAGYAAQMHSWGGEGSPVSWIEKYPPNSRIVLSTTVSNCEEALRLSDDLQLRCQ